MQKGLKIMLKFRNFTPHDIVMNDGRVFKSEGLARVSSSFSKFDDDGIADVVMGAVTGLPEPEEGTAYIVSSIVKDAAKLNGRNDVVAPATGHPDCVRENGQIVSVPGFIR